MDRGLFETEMPEKKDRQEKNDLNEQCLLNMFKQLAVRQRAVLSLRCYEKMSFSEISEVMNCGKWQVKRIFKASLARLSNALKANRLNYKMLVPILILFGIITGESDKKMDSLRLRELIGGRLFLGIINKFILSIIIAFIFCINVQGGKIGDLDNLTREEVKSVNYVIQGVWKDKGKLKSKGFYEKNLYFPDGPDGAVFFRMQRWAHKNLTGKLCSWLQNGDGYYYYHSGQKTVYISNDPLSLRIIPTDTKEMVDYVNKAFNRQSDVEYQWHLDQTILKSMTDSRIESTGTFFNEVSYNSISADFFDYDNWVGQAKVVDMRDKMRKRGWTYLEINGEYDGRKVTGRGRIPFTYNMKQQYQPWLDIEIEDTARIIDCNNIAAIQTKSGDRYFKSGTFFIGLHKPWQGYRVEEAVARDAIRCGADISRFMSNVRVDYKKDGGTVEIYYMLSGNENLIKMITIKNGNKQGRLMLTYHQDIDNPDGQFIQPEAELPEGVNVLSGNVNWLVDVLADKDGLASYPPKAEKTIEDEQVVMDELRKQLRKCRPPMY